MALTIVNGNNFCKMALTIVSLQKTQGFGGLPHQHAANQQ
jgi:hypothetical protein